MMSPLAANPEFRSPRSGRPGEIEIPRAVAAQFDRLRFEQGWVEAEFLANYRADTLAGMRRTMKVVLALQLLWSPFDWQVAPGAVNLLWPLRYGLTCPLLLGFLLLSRHQDFDRFRNAALFTVSIVLSFGAIAITMMAGPNGHLYYFPGMILATFGCGTSPGHRFRVSTCLNLGMFLVYELVINFVGTNSISQILTNTIWLFWANLASMSTAYAIERQQRFDFWQRRIIRDQSEELQRAIRKVEESRKEVERISRIDPLTGLFNRRHFFGEARRGVGRVAIVILDVDHFKMINDRFGHSTGDRILKEVADRIKASIRPDDVACRYGGEEFAILLPAADIKVAAAIAERLRQTVEATPFDADVRAQAVTVSVGVAAVEDRDGGIEALIDRADKALYEAKNAGRNRVKLSLHEPKSSLARRRVSK
jgi:diguanylate cyclase (GGDEF)-like protein